MNKKLERLATELRKLYEAAKHDHVRCGMRGSLIPTLGGRTVCCTRSEFHPGSCVLDYE